MFINIVVVVVVYIITWYIVLKYLFLLIVHEFDSFNLQTKIN